MNRKIAIVLVIILNVATGALGAEKSKYESHGRRDPFMPLVGKERPAMARLEDVESIDDIKLEGIAIDAKGARIAIINGEMLKKGDRRGNIEINDIAGNKVTLSITGKPYTINFTEEGGSS